MKYIFTIRLKYLNNSLIDLRNSINSKKLSETENLNKISNIEEKLLDFNKQQKGRGHHSNLVILILLKMIINKI